MLSSRYRVLEIRRIVAQFIGPKLDANNGPHSGQRDESPSRGWAALVRQLNQPPRLGRCRSEKRLAERKMNETENSKNAKKGRKIEICWKVMHSSIKKRNEGPRLMIGLAVFAKLSIQSQTFRLAKSLSPCECLLDILSTGLSFFVRVDDD